MILSCFTVDGGLSNWAPWSQPACPVTCGTSSLSRSRERFCNNPTPAGGGRACSQPLRETGTLICGTDACPSEYEWNMMLFRNCSVRHPAPNATSNVCVMHCHYISKPGYDQRRETDTSSLSSVSIKVNSMCVLTEKRNLRLKACSQQAKVLQDYDRQV